MKKLIILLSACFFVVGVGARSNNKASQNLQKLLGLYQSDMVAFFASVQNIDNALPAFFCDVSFANDSQVENFLRQVSTSTPRGQMYSQVSYTEAVSINGIVRAVSYNLTNDRGNVKFVKSANVNGQLLRAVYTLDPSTKKLKTATFDGKKAIRSNEYSL
ncbi:MAG TPA: hypothetical protein PLY93_00155 [Turneriella sp.]|nr:hypothetical protein [Turneriella sp.]